MINQSIIVIEALLGYKKTIDVQKLKYKR